MPPQFDDANPAQPQAESASILNFEEFERSLLDVEQSLLLLKAQYSQIRSDLERRQDLLQRQRDLQGQLPQIGKRDRASLQKELARIQQKLDDLERSLASDLFSQWFIFGTGIKELFWQAVRFGGLGLVVGWMLRAWAGGS